MSSEYLDNSRQELVDSITEKLEKGEIPWSKPWFRPDYFKNVVTDKAYNGLNILRLGDVSERKGYTDPRFCTFEQAKQKGWSVKKGEKGVKIEYWANKEYPQLDREGKPVLDADGKQVMVTRPAGKVYTVFNVSQIEGKDIPPYEPRKREWEPVTAAEKLLTGSGAVIVHTNGDNAYYSLSQDTITLPLQSQFKSAEGYYGTALHELGHWTGHESRLNRNMSGIKDSPSYAKEELRAELASCFVANEIGIQTEREFNNNASYIQSWISVLKEDRNEIFAAGREAGKAANYMLEFAKEKEMTRETLETTQREPPAEHTKEETKNSEPQNFSAAANSAKTEQGSSAKQEEESKDFAFAGKARERAEVINFPNANGKTFEEFAKDMGLVIDGQLISDGQLHRVPVEGGKPRAKDGAYLLHDDEHGRAGFAQNYKTGEKATFREEQGKETSLYTLTQEDKERIARAQEERNAAIKERQDKAARKAYLDIKYAFVPADSTNKYLGEKGVQPHDTLIGTGGNLKDNLIVPLKNINGEIRSYQNINNEGGKFFMEGGQKTGCFHQIGKLISKDVIICEGFATGASIHEATKTTVLCAMDAGNLRHVAEAVREKYGDKLNIVIAADNDHNKDVNTGIEAAKAASKAVDGQMIYPKLTQADKDNGLKDFNDIAKHHDKAAVKAQFDGVLSKQRENELAV